MNILCSGSYARGRYNCTDDGMSEGAAALPSQRVRPTPGAIRPGAVLNDDDPKPLAARLFPRRRQTQGDSICLARGIARRHQPLRPLWKPCRATVTRHSSSAVPCAICSSASVPRISTSRRMRDSRAGARAFSPLAHHRPALPARARDVRPRDRRSRDLPRRRSPEAEREQADEHGRLLRDNVYGTQPDDAARRDFTINALFYDPATQDIMGLPRRGR